ncbi:MAG: hypothetical protein ACI9FZ_000821 [Bacteroidia bacterium]|jgi:hypothetical protein
MLACRMPKPGYYGLACRRLLVDANGLRMNLKIN